MLMLILYLAGNHFAREEATIGQSFEKFSVDVRITNAT